MPKNVTSVNSSISQQPVEAAVQSLIKVTYKGRTYTYTQEELDQAEIRHIVGGVIILVATAIFAVVSSFTRP